MIMYIILGCNYWYIKHDDELQHDGLDQAKYRALNTDSRQMTSSQGSFQ